MSLHVSVRREWSDGVIKRSHGTVIEQWTTGVKYIDALGIERIAAIGKTADCVTEAFFTEVAEVSA